MSKNNSSEHQAIWDSVKKDAFNKQSADPAFIRAQAEKFAQFQTEKKAFEDKLMQESIAAENARKAKVEEERKKAREAERKAHEDIVEKARLQSIKDEETRKEKAKVEEERKKAREAERKAHEDIVEKARLQSIKDEETRKEKSEREQQEIKVKIARIKKEFFENIAEKNFDEAEENISELLKIDSKNLKFQQYQQDLSTFSTKFAEVTDLLLSVDDFYSAQKYKEALSEFEKAEQLYAACTKLLTLKELFRDLYLLQTHQDKNPLKTNHYQDIKKECKEKNDTLNNNSDDRSEHNEIDSDNAAYNTSDNKNDATSSILTEEALAEHDATNSDAPSVKDDETESTTSTATGVGIKAIDSSEVKPPSTSQSTERSNGAEEAGSSSSSSEFHLTAIPNLADGNCAVYAIRDMLKTINHRKGDITDSDILSLRKEICSVTKIFLALGNHKIPNENDTSKSATYLELYKTIFEENGFSAFKSIITRYIDDKLYFAAGVNPDTKSNFELLKGELNSCNHWQDLDAKTITNIFAKCSTFDVATNNIISDHSLKNNTTPDEYYTAVSESSNSISLTWLDFDEIKAYLIKLGFINSGSVNQAEGTCIKFTNSADQEIYLHSNGVQSNSSNGAAGSHWEAMRLQSQSTDLDALGCTHSTQASHNYGQESENANVGDDLDDVPQHTILASIVSNKLDVNIRLLQDMQDARQETHYNDQAELMKEAVFVSTDSIASDLSGICHQPVDQE